MANRWLSVDNGTLQLPPDVRAVQAENIEDPASPEGAAVLAVASSVGGGGGVDVTLGPTPPTNGFWAEAALPTVVATAPTFTDLSGTASDTYTVPSVANVIYRVGGVITSAGTYPGSGSVTITAEAASGFELIGTDTWSHTFLTGTDPIPVTPTAPTFNETTDQYTIPTTTGVNYQISGSTVAAGTYTVTPPVSVTINAVAQAGYTITGTASWTHSFTAPATMWKPAGSTVLTSDSFTGSGNAESRATDVAWGGSPVTPAATVAGAFVVDGDNLDMTAVGRLRYTVAGSGRVYLGVKVRTPLGALAIDLRYGLPTSAGSVPAIKLVNASAQNRAQLYSDGTAVTPIVVVADGDEVGLLVDGTVIKMYVNGVEVAASTTAVAANTTHGFVSFGAVANVITDFIVAALA